MNKIKAKAAKGKGKRKKRECSPAFFLKTFFFPFAFVMWREGKKGDDFSNSLKQKHHKTFVCYFNVRRPAFVQHQSSRAGRTLKLYYSSLGKLDALGKKIWVFLCIALLVLKSLKSYRRAHQIRLPTENQGRNLTNDVDPYHPGPTLRLTPQRPTVNSFINGPFSLRPHH